MPRAEITILDVYSVTNRMKSILTYKNNVFLAMSLLFFDCLFKSSVFYNAYMQQHIENGYDHNRHCQISVANILILLQLMSVSRIKNCKS